MAVFGKSAEHAWKWDYAAAKHSNNRHITTKNEENPMKIADFLQKMDLHFSEETINKISEKFKQNFKNTIYELLDEYSITSFDILQYFSTQYGLPIFDMTQFNPEWIKDAGLKHEVYLSHWTLPLSCEPSLQKLAIIAPTQLFSLQDLMFYLNKPIQFYLVDAVELRRLIELHCQSAIWNQQLKNNLMNVSPLITEPEDDQNNDEPVIHFVNQLIEQGIQKKISDIHIEPASSHYRLRFRQDGLLQLSGELPQAFAQRMIARIKILSKLDITEKRLPQDGRFQYQSQQLVHIRVSACPSVLGEKIVLRLLEGLHQDLSLEKLGLEISQFNLIKKYLSLPQGLIIVTGATGSGKTMTLYAALKYLNKTEKNICSVEDPVEIYLNGIHQVNINDFIHLDFANVLRALLRQDPDIMMIGEIRDHISAQVAVDAAQTGHLVLTTLHTNSAQESITRFLNLKVPEYLLANALSLVISQRLVRVLCAKCKIEDTLIKYSHLKSQFKNIIYKAQGCHYCRQGYVGRIGIFECLELNPDRILSLVHQTSKKVVSYESDLNLWQAGIHKVHAGITSIEELYRSIKEGDPHAHH